jgi:hypothetical protein
MAPVLTDKFGKIIILSGVCFQPTELSWRRQPLLGKHLVLKDGLMAALVRVLLRLLFVAASLAVFTTATWAQGNPGAAAESATVAKLQSIARKNISDNRSNFPDATDFFRAAPGYPDVYLSDLGLTMTGLPEAFSAEQVKNIIDKFLLRTNSSGWIPMALKKDGSVYVYCSAWDRRCAHPTGDGAFFLPLLEELYWRKTNSTAQFVKDAPKIKAALEGIPRDPKTGCVQVVPGDEWVAWAFEEEARKTGLDAIGCIMYWRAASAVAILYRRVGDNANSKYFLDQANLIQSSLQSRDSALWDSSAGMYYAASRQNRQIDILASTLAVYCGLPSSAQQAAISAWLVKNYSAIIYQGYVLQSPATWETVGYISADKGLPYGASPFGAKSYQSAYWSVGNRWVSEALYLKSPGLAAALTQAFAANPDPTMEYYAPDGNPKHGFEQNLESPIGSTAFAIAHDDLF